MEDSKIKSVNLLPIETVSLWQGCMLALSVHAVMVVEYPFTLDEHAWYEGLYITLNHESAKAVLYFTENNVLLMGLFREFNSERTELVLSDKYAASHFKPASEQVRNLAKDLCPILNQEVGNKALPVVTTGFWVEKNGIYSVDSYENWFEHGGSILDVQMMPFDKAMVYYTDTKGLDAPRAQIVERVYREKIQRPDNEIYLSKEEVELIKEYGEYNMSACQDAFEQIGVYFT